MSVANGRQIEREAWSKIRAALEDPRWDFRTVDGIAREAQLNPKLVRQLLESNRSEIRQTIARDLRVLYTLKSRRPTLREFLADIQMFASQ